VRLTLISFGGGRRSSSSSGGDADNMHGSMATRPDGSPPDCIELGTVRANRDPESYGGTPLGGQLGVESSQKLRACPMRADRRRGFETTHDEVLFDSDTNEIIVQLNSQAVRAELAPFVIKYEGWLVLIVYSGLR